MTWTYSTALSLDRDKVRFMLGDVDTTDPLISDEEIAGVIGMAGTTPPLNYVAAACADFIAAKFARKVDTSNLSVSVSASQRFAQYTALAARLRASPPGSLAGGDGSGVALATMFVGGRVIAEVEARENDSSINQPAFSRGQFDNPNAGNDPLRGT